MPAKGGSAPGSKLVEGPAENRLLAWAAASRTLLKRAKRDGGRVSGSVSGELKGGEDFAKVRVRNVSHVGYCEVGVAQSGDPLPRQGGRVGGGAGDAGVVEKGVLGGG